MAKTKQDFELWAGDTKTIRFTVTNADGSALTQPIVSAKWWAAYTVQTSAGQASIKKSTASGTLDIIDGDSVQLTIEPTDTLSLTPRLYYHELETVDAAGDPATASTGQMTLHPTIIR